MKNKLGNPFIRFIILFSILVFLWFSFYHNIYRINTFFHQGNKTETFDIQKSISIQLAKHANLFVKLFGYTPTLDTTTDYVVTSVKGKYYNHGVWIGEPCNGIKVFGLFSIFIIVFPGSLGKKIWFIPLGVFIIYMFNALRIALLTIISAENPKALNFNHNITFQVLVYGLIFVLWLWWVNKFSDLKLIRSQSKNDV